MVNRYVLTFLAIFWAFNTITCLAAEDDEASPVSGASYFNLSDAELSSLKEKALAGDVKAAYRIYQYYEIGMGGDTVSAFSWLHIAANGNDAIAQYTMGYICIYSNVFKNISLARFWLKEASNNGDVKARRLLEDIKS
jgi:TPR repeat protein